MNPQPDLSVIILTFNTKSLTLACLHTLPPDPPIEIIVVDNASTDGTVDALHQSFPLVNVIVNATNYGFGRGNNIGMAASHGRYLLVLNSDTEVQPGSLAALITYMDAHPEVGACGPMLINTNGSLQPSGRPLPTVSSVFMDMTKLHRIFRPDVFTQRGRNYSSPTYVGEISGAALMIRREAYNKAGGFDEHFFAYYEDVDLCNRIARARFKIAYVPQARVMHHWRATSRNVSELSYRAGQESLRYYFRKHHGPVSELLIKTMLIAKELVLLAISTIRLDADALHLHRRMLVNLFSPLTGSKVA